MKLKSKITKFTTNINKLVNNNTIKISNKIINDFKSKSKTNARANVTTIMKNITVIPDLVNIQQNVNHYASKLDPWDAKLTMAAIINILSSTKQKTDLAKKVTAALNTQIKTKLQYELQQAAAIQKKAVEANGFGNMVGNMVDKLTDMVEEMVAKMVANYKGSSSSKSNSDIEKEITRQISRLIDNEINNTTIYTTINTSDIVNKLSMDLSNSITNMSIDSCLGSTESRNMAARLNEIAADGPKITVLQVAKSDAIAKCISTKKIGNKALTGLTNDNSYKSILDTSNKSSSDSKGKQVAKIKDIKENRDAINDSLDGAIKTIGGVAKEVVKEGGKTARMGMSVILLPVIIIGLIIVAVIGIKLASSAGDDGDDDDDDDDDDMDGGEIIDFAKFFDIPLAKRGLTLIIVFIILDIILKKTIRKT